MEWGFDRRGLLVSLVIAVAGIGITILWPDKKELGWAMLAIAALIFCGWLVFETILWLGRTKAAFLVSALAFTLVFGGLYFIYQRYGGTEKSEAAPNSGFAANFRTQFVNIPINPNTHEAFFGFLSGYGPGQQLSPVSLLTFISLRSKYSHPIQIRSYSAAIETRSCGWITLVPLDTRAGMLLRLHPPQQGPSAPDWVLDTSDSLDNIFGNHPLEPEKPIEGVLLFATRSLCKLDVGDTINIRLDLRDSEDKSFSLESDLMPIKRDTGPVMAPTTDSTYYTLKSTGIGLDTSRVIHRNAADALPSFMNMDSLQANKAIPTQTSAPFGLIYPDGTYIGRR
jgi:hypothetical protein